MSFERVIHLFRAQQAGGAFPGGQLVVRRAGSTLIDLAVGTARGLRADEGVAKVMVTPDTPFQVMSASKPVLAALVAHLEAEGLIDLSAPVRRYFPEFIDPDVTIRDVVLHRSGITLPELSSLPELWHDWGTVVRALRREPPSYRRGTLAYQPIAFGWILTEVVQRITGASLAELTRRLFPIDLAWQTRAPAARTYWLGSRRFMMNGANLAEHFEVTNNTIAARTALAPGAGMYASARSLAAFYELLLVPPWRERLAAYTRAETRGFDAITRAYLVLGRGFAMGWRPPHVYGWWNTGSCFGHAGGFSVVAYADRATGAAVAIVTNGNRSVGDLVRRTAPLGSAIRRALRDG